MLECEENGFSVKCKSSGRLGNTNVKPNVITFNAAISAWGNGRDPQRVARAQALLQEMRKLYRGGVREVKPDVLYVHFIDSSLDQK